MRLLITGAGGQLGREFQAAAAAVPQHDFIFADHAALDVADTAAARRLLRRLRVEAVVNAAAFTQVDLAETQPELAERVNHRGAACLAQAAAEAESLLIHISTDYVFDGSKRTPYTEQDRPAPLSAYGRTKLAGEQAVRAAGGRHLILRTAWLYSTAAGSRNFVNSMRRLMQEKKELRLVTDQIGSPTCAADLAADILRLLSAPLPPAAQQGTYHYAGAGACSRYEWAAAIRRLCGAETCRLIPCTSAEYPPLPAPRPAYSALSSQAFEAAFGRQLPHWQAALARRLSAPEKRG